jgi:putative transposase
LTGIRDRTKRKHGKKASQKQRRANRHGYTSKANRPHKGLLFVCQCCHYILHADLVGARNISLRTLAIRQDWMATGQLSGAPDVTDDEAKAARLRRYAGLRWSPATSPLL